MPTYQYQCTECHEALEAVQKFSDDALTECPNCRGGLRKIFSAVGVVFKGSGFYRTDSRSSSPSSAPAAKSGGSSDSKPSDSGSKPTSTPAAGSASSSSSTSAA